MKTKIFLTMVLAVTISFTALARSSSKNVSTKSTEKALYHKKYTNADYYTNGVFNKEVARQAFLDMFAFYGVEYTEFMKKNMFITDFNLGDFEHIGMGGIFWINDAEHNVFGHEIYLLPNQMIAEHAHVKSAYAAKHETGLVRNGSGYIFSIGESTPNPPALPVSQKNFITLTHFEPKKVGDLIYLAKIESKHFLYAGDHGIIVTEFGTFHDNAGLRFTNPSVKF